MEDILSILQNLLYYNLKYKNDKNFDMHFATQQTYALIEQLASLNLQLRNNNGSLKLISSKNRNQNSINMSGSGLYHNNNSNNNRHKNNNDNSNKNINASINANKGQIKKSHFVMICKLFIMIITLMFVVFFFVDTNNIYNDLKYTSLKNLRLNASRQKFLPNPTISNLITQAKSNCYNNSVDGSPPHTLAFRCKKKNFPIIDNVISQIPKDTNSIRMMYILTHVMQADILVNKITTDQIKKYIDQIEKTSDDMFFLNNSEKAKMNFLEDLIENKNTNENTNANENEIVNVQDESDGFSSWFKNTYFNILDQNPSLLGRFIIQPIQQRTSEIKSRMLKSLISLPYFQKKHLKQYTQNSSLNQMLINNAYTKPSSLSKTSESISRRRKGSKDWTILGIRQIFRKVPPLENDIYLYRGWGVFDPDINKLEKGTILESAGFTSTTSDDAIAYGFADSKIVFRIHVPAQSHILNLEKFSRYPFEKEYLLPENAKFIIKDKPKFENIYRKNDPLIIDVQYLP